MVSYLQVAVSSVVRVKFVEVVLEANAPDGVPLERTGGVESATTSTEKLMVVSEVLALPAESVQRT